MITYIVITVYAGCVSDVKGFSDHGDAEDYLMQQKRELGIEQDQEEESEYDVQLHELDIETYPVSVMVRRQRW